MRDFLGLVVVAVLVGALPAEAKCASEELIPSFDMAASGNMGVAEVTIQSVDRYAWSVLVERVFKGVLPQGQRVLVAMPTCRHVPPREQLKPGTRWILIARKRERDGMTYWSPPICGVYAARVAGATVEVPAPHDGATAMPRDAFEARMRELSR